MTTTDEKPTIGERYSVAVSSSNLRVTEKSGDIDLMIAAGWVPDSLGGLLFRLRREYDMVSAEVLAVELQWRAGERTADEEAASVKIGPTRAEAIRQENARAMLTARFTVLSKLKTLDAAKAELMRAASVEATRKRYMRPDAALPPLIGRVLDVFLDPLCHHCQGRGFNGAAMRGEVEVICRKCRGSGDRRKQLGQSDADRDFAEHMLCEMERRLADTEAQLRRYVTS